MLLSAFQTRARETCRLKRPPVFDIQDPLCGELGVQFLDQTVALARTRLCRDDQGRMRWERMFRFEFSESGIERYPGRVTIVGRRATWMVLDGARIGRVMAEGDRLT